MADEEIDKRFWNAGMGLNAHSLAVAHEDDARGRAAKSRGWLNQSGQHRFEIQIYLNNLDRQSIKVELYSATMTKEMEYLDQIPNSHNGHIYRLEVSTEHQASSFTPRIIPDYPGVAIPLEMNQILWQKWLFDIPFRIGRSGAQSLGNGQYHRKTDPEDLNHLVSPDLYRSELQISSSLRYRTGKINDLFIGADK